MATPDTFAAGRIWTAENKRSTGVISLQKTTLTFDGEEKLVWLLSEITLERGGANNSLLFVRNPKITDSILFSSDKGLLKALAAVPDVALQKQVTAVESAKRRSRYGLLTVLAVLVFLVIGIFSARDLAVSLVARQVPLSWEEQVGETLWKVMRTQSDVMSGTEIDGALKAFLAPLDEVARKNGYSLRPFVVKSDEYNAFALPGGYVVVHTAVIESADRAEEVLGVLAHELGHVTRRHILKQLISTAGLYFMVNILIGDVAGVLAAVSDIGPFLLRMSFSRDYEREADIEGWKLLQEAKIDPSGMVDSFRKLAEKEKQAAMPGLNETLSFVGTHPATTERVATLEKKLQELPKREYRTFDAEFQRLREAILPSR